MTELDDFRREIDAIDDEILALLGKRFAVVRRVADYKAPRGIPAIIPERIEAVREGCARRGARLGLDPDFLRVLYSLIIDEACRLEEELIAGAPGSENSPDGAARSASRARRNRRL
jgi:4-amino-4-deoxychorismate mutase